MKIEKKMKIMMKKKVMELDVAVDLVRVVVVLNEQVVVVELMKNVLIQTTMKHRDMMMKIITLIIQRNVRK
jgi:hypothetical protein